LKIIFTFVSNLKIKIMTNKLDLNQISIDELLNDRKQWYLDNEYKCSDENLAAFDRLLLENRLAIEMQVLLWIYSR
jgi:hypothetical protein